MKKIVILLLNVLLVTLAITTTFSEVTGDATGNATLAYGPSLTVSTDMTNDDLVSLINEENVDPKKIEDITYFVYVEQPTVSSEKVTWNISLWVDYLVDDNWSDKRVTESLPGTITLELGLPEGFMDSVTEVASGYERKWVIVATHEDGTTSEYEAKLDESTGMVTVVIDQFSTFELSYTDTSTSTEEESTTVETTPAPTDTTTTTPATTTTTPSYTVVNTGDR